MLKEMIDRILALASPEVIQVEGRNYAKSGLVHIKPSEFHNPDFLKFRTLTGMADFVKKQFSKAETKKMFLHVDSYKEVALLGELQPENNNKRFSYGVTRISGEPFSFGNWYDLETFIIALQSQFVETQEINDLISHLGHIANETIVDNTDDGFSQTIQVKTGITTKSEVVIENPMALRPYRTFMEIEQPESQHIFRIRTKGGMSCTLVEGDGGKWKLDAIQSIKEWLAKELPEMTIIA